VDPFRRTANYSYTTKADDGSITVETAKNRTGILEPNTSYKIGVQATCSKPNNETLKSHISRVQTVTPEAKSE
jgi:hypothetical protein